MSFTFSRIAKINLIVSSALLMLTSSGFSEELPSKNEVSNNANSTLNTAPVAIAPLSFATSSIYRNRQLRSGVKLKLGVFVPTSKFDNTSLGINFQFGSTFYIGPEIANKFRFGLDCSWLDFSYSSPFDLYFKLHVDSDDPYSENYNSYSDNYLFNFGFLGVGPIASYSPNEKIAIDVFFKVLPVLSIDNDLTGFSSFSFSSLYGVNFRYKVYTVGIEHNSGKIDYSGNYDSCDSHGYELNYNYFSKINNLRFVFGVKF